MSLLAGLKRHFRFKAAEGLLSATSLRLLDYACDACLSKPGMPLDFFKTVRCSLAACRTRDDALLVCAKCVSLLHLPSRPAC